METSNGTYASYYDIPLNQRSKNTIRSHFEDYHASRLFIQLLNTLDLPEEFPELKTIGELLTVGKADYNVGSIMAELYRLGKASHCSKERGWYKVFYYVKQYNTTAFTPLIIHMGINHG